MVWWWLAWAACWVTPAEVEAKVGAEPATATTGDTAVPEDTGLQD